MERDPTSHVTIYEVARHASVSIATVSRVLNDYDRIRPSTREQVLRAINELNYVPNTSARGLSGGTKSVIGLVFMRTPYEDDFEIVQENLLFTDAIIRGVERACSRRGYSLLLRGVDHDNLGGSIDRLTASCDGIILLDRTLKERFVPAVAKKLPTVLLAGSGKSRSALTVMVDNQDAITHVATHLVEVHHHRQLAFLSGFADSPDSYKRREAFVAAATALGATIEPSPEWVADYTSLGAARVVEHRLASGERMPEAIACVNDQSAIGVIHALTQAGLKVPDDIAVTGFDDIAVARQMTPALTTVHQPVQELGSVAADALMDQVAAQRRPSTLNIVLPTKFIVRESCGCNGA